jgi:lipopolysaccharide export system protein LptC
MITRKTQRGIITLISLTIISYWIGHSDTAEAPEPVIGLDPKLNYVLHDFELQFFDENGQPTLNMRAPVLRNDPEIELGTIEGPIIRLNQADTFWDLTAETATVTADKEHVRLLGDVHVERHEPLAGLWAEMDTRNVWIEVTPQTAKTDEPVSVFDGNNRMDAIGLELDMNTNTFLLKEQVKATYAVN